MKKLKLLFFTLVVLLFDLSFAYAGHLPPVPCDVNDVKFDSIQVLDGSPAVNVTPVSASECYGGFDGNNYLFTFPTNGNLGYDDDGWLNSESDFWPGPGAFVEEAGLLDLDGDGN